VTGGAKSGTGSVFYLSSDKGNQSFKYDNSIPPVLTVESGSTVVVQCADGCDNQIVPERSPSENIDNLDWNRIHALTGPIAVAGAEPGDILKVEILELAHNGKGWTAIFPGFGLLPHDFGDYKGVFYWKVGSDGRAELKPGVRVPIEPFMGEMGVAPKEKGAHSTMPPRPTGGNLDVRQLCKGTIAYFPVEVPGALFSVGDGHLAQGDGEVCCFAIEAALTATLKLSVLKGRSIPSVQFETSGPTTSKYDGMGYYVTTATGLDLAEGARVAVRSMIDHLAKAYGLSRVEAYMLCSVAGDLKIAVPVLGAGHASNVTFHLPKSVFVG
jgi:acetamidase/formamidase